MFMFERVGNEPWQPCTYPHDKRTGFEPSSRAVALVNLTRSYKTRQPLHHLNVVLICLCLFWLSSMLWSFLINTRQTSVIIYSVSLERKGGTEWRGAGCSRKTKCEVCGGNWQMYVVKIERKKVNKGSGSGNIAPSSCKQAVRAWASWRVGQSVKDTSSGWAKYLKTHSSSSYLLQLAPVLARPSPQPDHFLSCNFSVPSLWVCVIYGPASAWRVWAVQRRMWHGGECQFHSLLW